MRKNKLLFVAFVAFIALSGCAKREIKNIDAKGKNIICFGDSITFGYGAEPGEDYPSRLAKMVSIPVINSGISADTSIDALKRINSDVLEKEPLLVIIEFAGNDFLKKVPMEVTLANVREMARFCQASGAMVAIADISAGMFLREYRIALSKLARQEQAIFIPGLLSGIITNPSMKSDFLHPNANGYRIVAERVYRVIKPYLK